MNPYRFKLEVFEGPLDLLLHLIEKHKIDICHIPIAQITDQYLAYLKCWKQFDIIFSSDFLVMAATLLQIKSRMLLPLRDSSEDDERDDPRDSLVQQLLQFQKIKEVSVLVERLQEENAFIFGRPLEVSQWGEEAVYDFSTVPLEKIFFEALHRLKINRVQEKEEITIRKDTYSIEMAMCDVLKATASNKRVLFVDYISQFTTRGSLVAAFLAILELLKVQQINCYLEDGQYLLKGIESIESNRA